MLPTVLRRRSWCTSCFVCVWLCGFHYYCISLYNQIAMFIHFCFLTSTVVQEFNISQQAALISLRSLLIPLENIRSHSTCIWCFKSTNIFLSERNYSALGLKKTTVSCLSVWPATPLITDVCMKRRGGCSSNAKISYWRSNTQTTFWSEWQRKQPNWILYCNKT